MELIRGRERVKYSGRLITHSIPAIGGKVIKLGTYEKWIEVNMGHLLAKLHFYEAILPDGKHAWALIDALGQLACNFQLDKDEVVKFLKETGWKLETKVEYEDEDEEMED